MADRYNVAQTITLARASVGPFRVVLARRHEPLPGFMSTDRFYVVSVDGPGLTRADEYRGRNGAVASQLGYVAALAEARRLAQPLRGAA